MIGHTFGVLAVAAVLAGCVHAHILTDRQALPEWCTVRADTEKGCLCGTQRTAEGGFQYASFRGVPYAEQPVGELRFKELQPLERRRYFDARNEGPICYQTDVLYGSLMKKPVMDECCIYANIHVPLDALPTTANVVKFDDTTASQKTGLPILVFIHGGGFAFGSGHTDIHGPEYLVRKNVIVITFNYRLNVFGFLSLNSAEVPGNAGLRDIVTLLRWVRTNARALGGDPDNVTLGGQSAGAIAAHLLTLSKIADEGLFHRAILMSGAAISDFYSPSPLYAGFINSQLLDLLGINATNPEDIHKQLIALPAEKLHEANKVILDRNGLVTFVPTVETVFPGVTTIVDDYPERLVAEGRDKGIPLLVGHTNAECETFRERLEEFDFVGKTISNPVLVVPVNLVFKTPPALLHGAAKKMLYSKKYYNGTISVDGFIKSCTDGYYEYPVMKLMEARKNWNAPTYVYRFSFDSTNSVLKRNKHFKFDGAGHVEDLMYVFKTNSVLETEHPYQLDKDEVAMREYMSDMFSNFIVNGKPMKDDQTWPAANSKQLVFEEIVSPRLQQVKGISSRQREITKFFDTLITDE